MNNNLLAAVQKWLTDLGIQTEAAQTFLKVNRADVANSGLFTGRDENETTGTFLCDLKSAVNSNKLYLEKGTPTHFHLNSF